MNEPDAWLRLALAILATWRVTHLLANEDGPGDLVVRLRAALGRRLLGALMDCFNCLSLWIAAPAALLAARSPAGWLVGWLAISGGACLLEQLGGGAAAAQDLEGEIDHVLRPETLDVEGRDEPRDAAGISASGG